jgi:hypothetical protein
VHRGFLPFSVSYSVIVDETWLINSLDEQEFVGLLYNNSQKKSNWLQFSPGWIAAKRLDKLSFPVP